MNAGQLRHRILVEEPITSQDDTGDELVQWFSHGRVWGSISPMNGFEKSLRREINAAMDTKIRIRWSPTMDRMNAKWRLTHQNVIYNVVSIANIDMARREIEIMAGSGINNG